MGVASQKSRFKKEGSAWIIAKSLLAPKFLNSMGMESTQPLEKYNAPF